MVLASMCIALSALAFAVPTPVRLPADVDDVFSLRANPAGLGFLEGSELHLVYGHELTTAANVAADATNGLGLFGGVRLLDGLTLAGAFELDVPGVRPGHAAERGTLGVGFGGRATALGFSFEHVAPGAGPTHDLLVAGLSTRPFSWLSVGLQVRDLGQTAGPRLYDLGLAVRPFTPRLLLSGRWRITQGDAMFGDRVDLAGRVMIEPLDGVFLGGGANFLKQGSSHDLGLFGQLALAVDGVGVETALEDTTRSTALSASLDYRSSPRPSVLAPRRVAVVELAGALTPEPRFNLLSRGFEVSAYGAAPLLLEALARSERDEGVFLKITPLSIGWAKAEELRGLIGAIRARGRRVDCELTGVTDLEYYLATACDSIVILPAMTLEVDGLASNLLFLGEALDKLGVKVEYVARGRYKSAPEQFTRTQMSDAEREALGAYVDRVYRTLTTAVAAGRHLEPAAVERALARGSVTSTEAVALKLVDQVLYPDELEGYLAKAYGRPVSYASGDALLGAVRPAWAPPPRVAVVHVDAAISGGESRDLPLGLGQSAGAQTIIGALESARTDPAVVAVVLRVDSPGGDSLASDLIARAVERVGRVKPVIASFGDVAASGGYYVAAPAKVIFAEATTLTGSIGVFSLKASIRGLAAKLGIFDDVIVRGPLANSGSVFAELSPEARAVMEKQVDDAYRRFLEVVARGRHRSVEEVRAVAEGRIWSGEDARAHGLVDEIGGFDAALARAKREAGLAPQVQVELVTLPANREALPDALRKRGEASTGAGLAGLLPEDLRSAAAQLLQAGAAAAAGRPLALLPFVVDTR